MYYFWNFSCTLSVMFMLEVFPNFFCHNSNFQKAFDVFHLHSNLSFFWHFKFCSLSLISIFIIFTLSQTLIHRIGCLSFVTLGQKACICPNATLVYYEASFSLHICTSWFSTFFIIIFLYLE